MNFWGVSQAGGDFLLEIFHVGGLEPGHDLAAAVDEELGEIPFDAAVMLVVLVCLLDDAGKHHAHGGHAEALKLGIGGQPAVQGNGVVAVDLHLGEPGEGGAELNGAEGVDLLVVAGSLTAELVAGEIQDLEALILEGS